MYCHKCGAKNNEVDIFCQSCGEKLYSPSGTPKESNGIKNTTAKLGEEALITGVKVVKKSHGLAFKAGIITFIFAIVIALANYYFSYMVSSPDGVVKTFMNATDEMDYQTMISCFDPKSQKLSSIGGDLVMDFIGSVTGFSIDFDTATTFSSAFGNQMVKEEDKCHATNFKVESIEGEKLSAFVNQFGTKIKSIGNLLGSKAIVSFEVENKAQCVANAGANNIPTDAKKIKYKVEVQNYDNVGWKIPGDMKFEYVEFIN